MRLTPFREMTMHWPIKDHHAVPTTALSHINRRTMCLQAVLFDESRRSLFCLY
jgi:hypothetical protein